ncbi:SRPBCC family protein [Amycolatopsis saalfeldensis]|uniref:Carbon monoxide dehydrogenase subunit G n=1 Tax=Amycolatopsis saalfeldensis TaxID=394193 RepID=A0A1H8YP58_9PSEU|nr:SRPBCC family protein [Amycolatopsis saalfeldensis]SEP53939.1 Carbon monoxide dehydrogenase subunit G [Amycolatopsis saalfeldensis]
MVQVQRTISVQRPVPAVVHYLRDFAQTEHWDPGTLSCVRLDEGPVQVGSRWRNVSRFRGKETELIYELVRSEPERLVFVGKNKTATSTDDLSFSSSPDGGVITYRATIVFHGLAKLAGPFLKREFEKLGDAVVEAMPKALGDIPA